MMLFVGTYNLFQVAVHELGHVLGLKHSGVYRSVMKPYYPGYNSNFKLGRDDIRGIQKLYGLFIIIYLDVYIVNNALNNHYYIDECVKDFDSSLKD